MQWAMVMVDSHRMEGLGEKQRISDLPSVCLYKTTPTKHRAAQLAPLDAFYPPPAVSHSP